MDNAPIFAPPSPQNAKAASTVFYRWVVLGEVLFIVGALCWLIGFFENLATLVGLSLVVCYILLIPVNLVEKAISWLSKAVHLLLPMLSQIDHSPILSPRVLSVILVYAFFLTVGSLAAVLLFPLLVDQLKAFSTALPGYIEQGEQVFWQQVRHWPVLQHWLGANGFLLPDAHPLSTQLSSNIEGQSRLVQVLTQPFNKMLAALSSDSLGQFFSLLSGTVNGVFFLLSGCTLVYYGLLDGAKLKQVLVNISPPATRPSVEYMVSRFHQAMGAFVKGQVMLGLLTGTYMFVIYSFFDVPFAFFLSAIFAVAEILPVVGTWIGITPGILVILFGAKPWLLIPVWLCSYVYQTIKDNILAPKVVGDAMGLHPAVVILALVISAKVAGLLGILLALPLTSMVLVLFQCLSVEETQENIANG